MGQSLRVSLPDRDLSPAVREKYERYTDQGGLLGAFTYAAVALETGDDDLAAAMASVPTNLFVTSSLHDDAIDEADGWDDRKRRLNEHVTLGDLVFTDIVETADSLPDRVDITPVLQTVRRIGTGQLREDAPDPETATLEDAIARVDERGTVWGDLAVALVDTVDGFSNAHRERLRRITRNAMFVLTVVDDVEDLPADIANGVVNVPIALYDGDLGAYDSETAAIEAFLESDTPRRLEAMLAERRAEFEADSHAFVDAVEYSNEAVFDAAYRALSWYCESICSIPVDRTVPAARRRELERRLAAAGAERRRCLEELLANHPLEAAVDREALTDAVGDLPADRLAAVLAMFIHVGSIADSVMSTSLEDAVASLERATATPP